MMLQIPDTFSAALAEIDVTLAEAELAKCGHFLDLLYEANERFNLTGVREKADAWERHIFDSLTLLPILGALLEGRASLEPGHPIRIADIGSGGGLPALPLAIVLPNVQFTLVEATGKKAAYLSESVATLELENVTVLNDRAEEYGKHGHSGREAFDFVTARAVGKLSVLLEMSIPLLKVGGLALFIKGQKAGEELRDAHRALSKLAGAHLETIPTPTGRIVIIEKEDETPREYPRAAGEWKRKPL